MNKTNSSSFNPVKLSKLESFKKTKSILGSLNLKVPIFLPYFDLSDLIQEDPSISDDLIEISKVILRNLSVMKTVYRYLNKLRNSKLINEDTNSSKMILKDEVKNSEHTKGNISDNNQSVNRSHRKKNSINSKPTQFHY